MKTLCNGTSFTCVKISASADNRPVTASSAGLTLTHWATRARVWTIMEGFISYSLTSIRRHVDVMRTFNVTNSTWFCDVTQMNCNITKSDKRYHNNESFQQ